MEHDEDLLNYDDEIDPEVWFQALLAMTCDKERRKQLIQRGVEKTGLPPEKVETFIAAKLNFVARKSKLRLN